LTIQGLDDDLDLKKICKALRKNLQCNGAIVKDKEFGDVVQLQGDHRAKVGDFLCDQGMIFLWNSDFFVSLCLFFLIIFFVFFFFCRNYSQRPTYNSWFLK
jgi:hypothetical protein